MIPEPLKWHYAGKGMQWICNRYKITKKELEEMILEYGRGDKS